jgi:predicted phosphodiesterase
LKIALISDVHEDIVSLTKALKMIELEKCDHIVCLGDILGYPFNRGKYENTRNAAECLLLIKKYCSIVLAGNHDFFHIKKLPKSNSNFKFPAHWYSLSNEEMIQKSDGKVWNYSDDYAITLSDNDLEYLNSLPEFVIKDYGEKRILYSHYLSPEFTGLVATKENDSKKLKEHFAFLHKNNCNLNICGHMHIEGMGLCYDPEESFLSAIFKGFMYYSYGEKSIKDKCCSISIPALADNGQVNGFAIFDTTTNKINVLSLNTNRRFIL